MSKSIPNTPEVWETLLEAVRETEPYLAGVAPFRDTLEDARARVILLKTTRDAQVTAAREARQSYREALTAGKDAAVALRGFIQSVLGMRNEQLLCYGIQPRGNRCRRKRKLDSASTSRARAAAQPK
ncbi:MAG TPA: hypothetical protein VGP73_11185 [Thermoanaerobaculia bacterium]